MLPAVREAEQRIMDQKNDKEYLPITGFPDFVQRAAILAYGKDSKPLKEGRIAITQSISGTGALRIGGAFLERWYPHNKTIYLPTPSWGNHVPIFKDAGLTVKNYRYYNKDTVGLDFEGLVEDLKNAPDQSISACFFIPIVSIITNLTLTQQNNNSPSARLRSQPYWCRPYPRAMEEDR